ncbi:hypothetical protein HDF16_004094 [Granulicella aggregans]|uniref:Uncharacterized protein n=1 Tax=Granulicella aggregans TaxID=474949 RepID=A0A7W8E587_9BACT|nr:hypothetical protein [Granulicella aggregans]
MRRCKNQGVRGNCHILGKTAGKIDAAARSASNGGHPAVLPVGDEVRNDPCSNLPVCHRRTESRDFARSVSNGDDRELAERILTSGNRDIEEV